MSCYRSGLPTSIHDKIDVTDFWQGVKEQLPYLKGKTIVETFCGGGRDILHFYNLLEGNGQFIAIDGDPLRIEDMKKKYASDGIGKFIVVESQSNLEAAFRQNDIAIINGEFPDQPLGPGDIDLTGTVDLLICCAGIMYIPPHNLAKTLAQHENMLAEEGTMVLRFSLERDDKIQELGESYFVHSPEHVQWSLENLGLHVIRHIDIPDHLGRSFNWVDMTVTKRS